MYPVDTDSKYINCENPSSDSKNQSNNNDLKSENKSDAKLQDLDIKESDSKDVDAKDVDVKDSQIDNTPIKISHFEKRKKYSSTSTVFVDHTLTNPDSKAFIFW